MTVTVNETRTLFVGQLPFTATRDELKDMFRCEIEDIKIPRHRNKNLNKGIAFVTFKYVDDMKMALAKSFELGGRTLVLKEAADEPPEMPMRDNPSATLFVGNLPYELEEKELGDHFPGCLDAVVCTKKSNGLSLGYGYVHYETVEAATEAYKTKRGLRVLGRTLRIDFDQGKQ